MAFYKIAVAISFFCSPVVVGAASLNATQGYLQSCAAIAKQISNASEVYYAPAPEYLSDLSHWMTSSSQLSACTVEVGSNEDTSKVIKILGANRTPFAVKSGGHASNPGYSSTPGVHISMTRFNQITLSSDKSKVTVGLGNIWTQVYAALQGSGRNVNGGRVPGPGTGGFSLGGGYSWFVNQFGLTCDTIHSATLILPNGTITTVDSTQPDLFFALKGGLNRFGIVTEIVYNSIPQSPQVYGGIQLIGSSNVPAVLDATAKFFDQNTDDKAQVILTLNGGPTGASAILLSFFDGPGRPAAFAPFDNVKASVSTLKTQTYSSFANSTPSLLESGHRGAFHTLSTTKLTSKFLKAVHNETVFYSKSALLHGANILSYDVEPFATDYGKHATDSAYPHSDSPLPLNLYFGWDGPENDGYWRNVMRQSVNHLTQVAKSEGILQRTPIVYPNYALASYTGVQVYGAKNLARLKAIRAKVDPKRVMDLAGGFQY